MTTVEYPSFEQIRMLPCYLERQVPEEFEDANGHMNVTGYLRLHDEGAWPFMASLGIDSSYIAERKMSLFDLEQHLRYLSEVNVGDRVAVHGRLLDRTEKLMHGLWFLLDLTNNRLSNTFEFVTAHVSLESRRTAPFPPDIAREVTRLMAAHELLAWSPPTSGALGLRT